VATLTGRHPVRSGLTQVVFPVHAIGMPNKEVTIAEVLKKEGYKTAFFGKYHVGDIDGSYPHQNGYDETLFTIYNQFGSQFFNKDGEDTGATIGFTEAQQDQLYTVDKEFRNPNTIPWAAEAKTGEKAKQFNKDYSYEEQLRFVEEVHKRSMDFIKASAKSDSPFLLNYWWHGPNIAGTHRLGRDSESSGGGDGDGMEYMDKRIGECSSCLKMRESMRTPSSSSWPIMDRCWSSSLICRHLASTPVAKGLLRKAGSVCPPLSDGRVPSKPDPLPVISFT
jgi:arylsulfatase